MQKGDGDKAEEGTGGNRGEHIGDWEKRTNSEGRMERRRDGTGGGRSRDEQGEGRIRRTKDKLDDDG